MEKITERLCPHCDSYGVVNQTQFWDEGGLNKLEVPIVRPMPFCRAYKIHLQYVEQILEGEDLCRKYTKDGMS